MDDGKSSFGSALLIAGAATCWGIIGIVNRELTAAGLSQAQIVLARVVVAFVFFGLYLLVVDRKAFRIRLKDIWCFIGTGVVSLTTFNFCYFSAMQVMSLSAAAVLLYTAPIFVVLMSAALFKERLTAGKLIALVLVVGGVACTAGLIGGGSVHLSIKGVALGLCSGIGYALYSIFSRYALQRGYSSYTTTFYTFAFAVVASVFLADIPGLLALSAPGAVETAAAAGTASTGFVAMLDGAFGRFHVIGWELFLGIVDCLIPYVLYTKGLEGMENGKASILATLEMVVATLVSLIVYREPFSLMSAVGIVMVLAGIAITNIRPKEDR